MTNKQTLDVIDINILAQLYADPAINNKSLAEAVGLAPSSCHERVKRLNAQHIIRGSQLIVDIEALGGHIQAMVAVRLSSHDRSTIAGFQQDLLQTTEVVSEDKCRCCRGVPAGSGFYRRLKRWPTNKTSRANTARGAVMYFRCIIH